jgi:hypothetical protein
MSLPSRGFSDVRVSTLRFDPRTYGGVMGILQLYPNGTIAPVTSITINSYDVSGGITVGNLSVLNNATIGGTLIANNATIGGKLITNNIQSATGSTLTISSNNDIIIQPPSGGSLGILGRTNITGPVRIAGTATRDPNDIFELWDGVNGHLLYDNVGIFGRWNVDIGNVTWKILSNGDANFNSFNILNATSAGVSLTTPTTVWGTGATSNSFLTVHVGGTPYRVPLFAV